jgi:hypothetical protein
LGHYPLDRWHRENAPKPKRPFVVQLWHGDMSYYGDGRRKQIWHREVMAQSEDAAIAVVGSENADEIKALLPNLGHEFQIDNAKWIVDRAEDYR